jgi:Kef-type K+ transport system membrane component KefB
LIFGALASATAPAATVDVLAEYDAAGPLTTTMLAVVGLDDAVALLLYSTTAVLAESILAGQGTPSLFDFISLPLIEIGGSLILGIVTGFILGYFLDHMNKRHDAMAVSIGFVLLCGGLAEALGLSLILTKMVLGMVVVNRSQEHGRHIRFTIEQAGPVIYVLFFALVGARFQLSYLPTMGLLRIAYVILRSFGKFSDAWLGGKIGCAQPVVYNNLSFGLLSQVGVAMGLAIASADRFCGLSDAGATLGDLIIKVICATTFSVQIIGPIFVKFAITRAGEVGQARLGLDVWASEGAPE